MWTNDHLTSQIQLMRQRVQSLYQRGGIISQRDELLAAAFEELELAMEHLQKLEAQQRQSYEEWLNDRTKLEVESQRYQHLFTNAPAGYLVTSLDGTIRNANPAAAKLLECTERQLVGRSIGLFTPEGQRREFRAQLAQLSQTSESQEWVVEMQSWERKVFKAGATVAAVRNKSGERPIALHWLIRAIAEQQQAEPALLQRQVGYAQLDNAQPEHVHGSPLTHDELKLSALAQQRFLFMAQISAELISAPDSDTMLSRVVDLTVPAIADACIIDLGYPQSDKVQRLVAAREQGGTGSVRILQCSLTSPSYTNPAAARQQALGSIEANGSEATARQELEAILRPLEPSSAIFAPIIRDEQHAGSITLVLSKSVREYNAIDVALVQELAHQLGDAVARLR